MLLDEYIPRAIEILEKVRRTQREAMLRAADEIAEAIARGNGVFVFGCSHAAILAAEVFYRAGGLALLNPIFAPGLTPDVRPITRTTELERLEGYGRAIIDTSPVRPGDVLIVHSVSGRNAVPVEMALEAKARGVRVIALTSVAYAASVTSRHSSGKRLHEVADVVLDNCGAPGDAVVEVPGLDQRTGPTSDVVGAAILHSVVAQVIDNLIARGITPPVFVSANLDGGDEHNARILAKYRDRIHYL
jgi:uncharacterized phosphosugar-binding protein